MELPTLAEVTEVVAGSVVSAIVITDILCLQGYKKMRMKNGGSLPPGQNPQEMDLSCVSTEEVKICDRREYIFTLFTHSLNSFRLKCPQRGGGTKDRYK